MRDIEMRANWIMAWAISIALNAAAFYAVWWLYAAALLRHGLLPAGGAL